MVGAQVTNSGTFIILLYFIFKNMFSCGWGHTTVELKLVKESCYILTDFSLQPLTCLAIFWQTFPYSHSLVLLYSDKLFPTATHLSCYILTNFPYSHSLVLLYSDKLSLQPLTCLTIFWQTFPYSHSLSNKHFSKAVLLIFISELRICCYPS